MKLVRYLVQNNDYHIYYLNGMLVGLKELTFIPVEVKFIFSKPTWLGACHLTLKGSAYSLPVLINKVVPWPLLVHSCGRDSALAADISEVECCVCYTPVWYPMSKPRITWTVNLVYVEHVLKFARSFQYFFHAGLLFISRLLLLWCNWCYGECR